MSRILKGCKCCKICTRPKSQDLQEFKKHRDLKSTQNTAHVTPPTHHLHDFFKQQNNIALRFQKKMHHRQKSQILQCLRKQKTTSCNSTKRPKKHNTVHMRHPTQTKKDFQKTAQSSAVANIANFEKATRARTCKTSQQENIKINVKTLRT